MKKFILLFSMFIVVVSCEQQRVNKKLLIEKEDKKFFEDKPFSGILIREFKDGSIRTEVEFKDGEVSGFAKEYYNNGFLKEELTMIKDGKREGTHTIYFENGRPEEIVEYVNDEPDGNKSEFYESGAIRSIEKRVSEDKIEFVSYWQTGNIYAEGFKNNKGKWNGTFKRYSEEGNMIKQIDYDNGEIVKSQDFE